MWSEVIDQVLLWSKVKRWRKASKCKSLINKVQVHLVLQKKRKETMVRQSRADIALLLQNGQLQQALPRVEQLYKEQCRLSAYEQIDLFCQCLTTNVPEVIKQSVLHCLPSEVHVAVSSLIFAASRCGELPELQMLRCFFRKYYGCRIDKDNVQLLPGNLVHHEMKENLCISSVPEDEKLRVITDIANKYTLHLRYQEHQEVSFKAEQKAEVLDIDIQDISSDNSDEGSTQTMNLKTTSYNSWSRESHLDTTPNCSFNGLNRNRYESSYTTKTNRGAALSAGTLSSETLQIHENSFIYLDDMKVKSSKQQEKTGKYGLNHLKQQSGNSEKMEKLDMDKRCSNRKNLPPKIRSRRLSTGDALAYNQSSMSVIDRRRSFDSSINRLKEQRGNSPGHVHPKLPNYEDVVSELKDIKQEYKREQSYSKHSSF